MKTAKVRRVEVVVTLSVDKLVLYVIVGIGLLLGL